MKTKLNFSVIVMLFLTILSYAQNRSNGTISLTTPVGALPPNNLVEAFRFRSGLVTQLDLGTTFDLSTASAATTQWFSLGRLTTPSQSLYGLRVQRAGRGLVMGYSGAVESTTATVATSAGNPFIQWVGNDTNTITPGNLEFRTSTSSTDPTTDKLSFTLRSNLTALLGETSAFVAVQNGPIATKQSSPKLDVSSVFNPGIFVSVIDGANSENFGLKSVITNTLSNNNYGVLSIVNSSSAANSVNIGVYGSSTGTQSQVAGPIGNYAGYFAGTVYATQGYFGSDARLKKDIKSESNSLEKLKLLNPVTYNFEQNQGGLQLNLPNGIQHGFIAQELEKVYPELVADVIHPIFDEKNVQTGTRTLKAVNYVGLISVLTESLKELSNEVTLLKEKLATSEKTYVVSNKKNFTDGELETIKTNGFYLGQNTPNPFRTSSVIEYSLPANELEASLIIFNLNGQTIKEYKLNETKGNVTIEEGVLGKGMYLYSLVSNGEEIITKKMIVN
jgi:hypothetical protein